jgi:hypothetical protein
LVLIEGRLSHPPNIYPYEWNSHFSEFRLLQAAKRLAMMATYISLLSSPLAGTLRIMGFG